MIDSTFSRATWLNSLHMSTLTLSLLEKEGFAREQLLEGSGITPADLLDLRRLISPWQEQQVFANACCSAARNSSACCAINPTRLVFQWWKRNFRIARRVPPGYPN